MLAGVVVVGNHARCMSSTLALAVGRNGSTSWTDEQLDLVQRILGFSLTSNSRNGQRAKRSAEGEDAPTL